MKSKGLVHVKKNPQLLNPGLLTQLWHLKKKNSSKAEYAEIQSIANSIPFVMVEPTS